MSGNVMTIGFNSFSTIGKLTWFIWLNTELWIGKIMLNQKSKFYLWKVLEIGVFTLFFMVFKCKNGKSNLALCAIKRTSGLPLVKSVLVPINALSETSVSDSQPVKTWVSPSILTPIQQIWPLPPSNEVLSHFSLAWSSLACSPNVSTHNSLSSGTVLNLP